MLASPLGQGPNGRRAEAAWLVDALQRPLKRP